MEELLLYGVANNNDTIVSTIITGRFLALRFSKVLDSLLNLVLKLMLSKTIAWRLINVNLNAIDMLAVWSCMILQAVALNYTRKHGLNITTTVVFLQRAG